MRMYTACFVQIIVAAGAADATAIEATAFDVDPLALHLDATASLDAPALTFTQDEQEVQDSADPFGEGSRYWTLTAGASRDDGIGEIYLTQFSVDHYVANNFALRLGATFGYANPDDVENGVQGGPEVGIRWHFFNIERFSAYLDTSAATVFHEHPLTEDSLRFNFDLQFGVGATWQMGHATHLQGGVRWHHLSNARIHGKKHNLGYDGPMIYLGIMKAF